MRQADDRGADDNLGKRPEVGVVSLIDLLHRALWLLDRQRTEIAAMVRSSGVDESRLQTLAQALSGKTFGTARTSEQQACERLLAQWKRVTENLLL